jgi:hypothetical protein
VYHDMCSSLFFVLLFLIKNETTSLESTKKTTKQTIIVSSCHFCGSLDHHEKISHKWELLLLYLT